MPINRRTGNWSLRSILVLFLIVSMVFTIFIMLFSSSVYRGVMSRNTGYTMELYAREQEKLLRDQLQSIKTALYALVNKEEVVDYLSSDRGYRAANVQYMTSLVNDIPRFVPIITDVLLATADQHITASTFNSSDIHNFMRRYDVLSGYYASGQTAPTYYSLIPGKGTEYAVAMVVPVQSAGNIGVCVAFSTLQGFLGNANFMAYPCVILEGDAVFYTNTDALPDAEWLRAHKGEQALETVDQQIIHLSVDALGWDIFFEYPLMAVDTKLEQNMSKWSLFSVIVFAVIEGLMVLAIYKIVVAPILSISNQSVRINSTTSLLDNPAGGRKELNRLVANINDMIVRTNQLTGEVKDAKLRLVQMENTRLKERNMFLQAQINPHFLYNMLECICGMAAKWQALPIRDMAQLLSRMYQYCLRSPDSTLDEEMACIALYEKILALRYEEGYSIITEIPEELLALPLPRMSLEPIVENSVQHGFVRGEGRHFRVRISAALAGDMLTITVSDNGCGIPPERMAELNRRLEAPSLENREGNGHIGLINVCARLRLSYLLGSGVTLQENESGGVDVIMRIRYGG